jgi:hypothetical protein
MNTLCRAFLVYLVVVSFPLSVNAQALWGNAHLGMSPSEVLRLYPNAEAPSEGRVLAGERKELLRLPFIAMGDIPSTVHFFFQSERLHSIAWRLSPQGDFASITTRYEELLQGLKTEQPASSGIESKRQLHMARFLSDEWTTAAGVRINISMFDAVESVPVRIGMSASGDGGAWLRLESTERQLLQQKQQAQRIEAIRGRKEAEAKGYNKFLDAWVGKDIGKLASKWGAPTGTTRLPNGEVIYVWDNKSEDWQCRTSVFTKAKGEITKWQWSGNNCKAPHDE